MANQSTGTVLLAGVANLSVAVAKIVGGLLSGSAAMLAEGAHSVADTLNEAFLLTALRRSKKPPDARHPFGYGKERYFWSMLAAVGIFVLGAGFSVWEGVEAILHPEELTSLVVVYSVLAASFVLEGASWLKALKQLRSEAQERSRGVVDHLVNTAEPAAKTVAFEDTAALIGIVVAAVGVTLHHFTGQAFWDGAASIAIGLLLVGVAYALGRENKSMLIGQALPEEAREGIAEVVATSTGIDTVVELLTMQLAPDEVLVAAKIDLVDEFSGADLEQYADEVERRVRERYPEVRHVFLDPTPAPDSSTEADSDPVPKAGA
jgi:cation diffusion facilitator family transporter